MSSREQAGKGKSQKQAKKTKELDAKDAEVSNSGEDVKPDDGEKEQASFSLITEVLQRVAGGAPWVRICFVGFFAWLLSAVWSLLGWLMVIGALFQLLMVVFFPVHIERASLILRPLLLFWYDLIQYVWCLRDKLPDPILGLESWVQKVIDHRHKK